MESINVPLPDFSFNDIAVSKAADIRRFYLYDTAILLYVQGGYHELENQLEIQVSQLYNSDEQLVCIIELLNYLSININEFKNRRDVSSEEFEFYVPKVNKLKYVLYSLAGRLTNYSFDKNAFNDEDVDDLNRKVNAILIKLDEIQVGQEIIFDDLDKLKSDFESLKSDFPLGKKRWYQRAAGIVVSYSATKGADEVYSHLRPFLKELLHQSQFIDKLLKG